MTRVALVALPQIALSYVGTSVVPPLGLSCLAGALSGAGHAVQIIDALGEAPWSIRPWGRGRLRGLTQSQILDRIEPDTELVGISNQYAFEMPFALELVRKAKLRFPACRVVVGGPNATALPEHMLANCPADWICLGEGEETIVALCRCMDGALELSAIDGLAYRRDGEIRTQPKRHFIQNLDVLPAPRRDLLPMENYLRLGESHGAARGRWATVLATRGCPHACTFCTSPAVWQRRVRRRSPSNVVDEMASLAREYAITDFHFEDENLITDRRWALELCDEIGRRGLRLTWQLSSGVRASVLDQELLRRLQTAGMTNLTVAPESGSPRVLELLNKEMDLDEIEAVVRDCARLGIRTTGFFMLAVPGETLADAALTLSYLRRLARAGLDDCAFTVFSPLPGSKLYDEMSRQGRILLDDEYFFSLISLNSTRNVRSWSGHISDRQCRALLRRAVLQFYFWSAVYHPYKTAGVVWHVLTGRQTTKLERVLMTELRHAGHRFIGAVDRAHRIQGRTVSPR